MFPPIVTRLTRTHHDRFVVKMTVMVPYVIKGRLPHGVFREDDFMLPLRVEAGEVVGLNVAHLFSPLAPADRDALRQRVLSWHETGVAVKPCFCEACGPHGAVHLRFG